MGKGSGMVSEASGGPLCVMVHSTDHGGKCSSSHTARSETIKTQLQRGNIIRKRWNNGPRQGPSFPLKLGKLSGRVSCLQ